MIQFNCTYSVKITIEEMNGEIFHRRTLTHKDNDSEIQKDIYEDVVSGNASQWEKENSIINNFIFFGVQRLALGPYPKERDMKNEAINLDLQNLASI